MERLEKDSIDLGTVNVFKLFRRYFIPTLLGMLCMSAVTAIDGICVGHGAGSDGTEGSRYMPWRWPRWPRCCPQSQ